MLRRWNLESCPVRVAVVAAILHLAAGVGAADPLDVRWSSDFGAPGIEGDVRAMVNWNGSLVAAGDISYAGGTRVQNVVMWNGVELVQMGAGLDAPVTSLAVVGSTLYAAGDFTASGATPLPHVARWTGSSWVAVGSGAPDEPSNLSLAVDGSTLLLLGAFSTVGSPPVAANCIAGWNGSAWSSVGNFNGPIGTMKAAVRVGSRLYAGGEFDEYNSLHYWDGSSWTYGFGALDGSVISLAAVGTDLYLHGDFGSADFGNLPLPILARWDGAEFTTLNDVSPDGQIYRIGVDNGQLFVVGNFVNTPGPVCAYWDGSNWSAGPERVTISPTWIATFARVGGDLFLGGKFHGFYDFSPGGGGVIKGAKSIIAWNGTQLRALGPGFGVPDDGYLQAVTSYGGQLVAAGETDRIGRTGDVNGIAAWNGTQWNALGTGLTQTQGGQPSGDQLGTWNGKLVVTGYLTGAGAITSRCIAAWNGTSWEGFAGGFEGQGARIIDYASQLIVTGFLGNELNTGTPLGQVARWTGSQWQTIGTISPTSGASAMRGTVWNGKLVCAGQFASINGVPAANIAQWDGTNWSALGSGLNGIIFGLAAHNGDLYASGLFTATGATPIAGRIARWNGSTWAPVGTGLDAVADQMTSANGKLYVSGQFGAAGGNPATRIAAWDGAAWSALGSGLASGYGGNNLPALCLASHNEGLFAAGFFNTAGDKSAQKIARWSLQTMTAVEPAITGRVSWVSQPSPNPASGRVQISYRLAAECDVEAAVFDVSGRLVRTLAAGRFPAAEHILTWDGRDDTGSSANSGVYYLRLTKPGEHTTRKVIWYR